MEKQCKGKTKSGKRCKFKQGLVNGYCKIHKDQDTEKEENVINDTPEDDYQADDNTFEDVACDVNKGLSGFALIFIAVFTFLIFMFFKRGKK